MTTALYRRYRPETFADVIGQEHVTEPLMQALRTGRIGHAYLFSGPRGCGKTTSARILARCLNCENGPTPTPCGTCDSCVALARGGTGSVDVIEIDAASHGGVDDARDLRERASYGPAQSRFKVYIIDEAHMVTPQGFNALLKIVEEPPEHVKFVFATTEPEKVIGTIRSRTHHYPFRLVPPAKLTAYMEGLCEQEQVAVAPGVLGFVTRAGGGSVRDSLSVLDQLIAGSGDEGLTYEGAASLLGFTSVELLDATIDAIAARDAASVFTQVDKVIESGHDPRRFAMDLLERLRDLIIIAAVPDGAAQVLRGVPEDQLDRMRGQQSRFGPGELSRAADIVNAGITEMTGATSPRMQLELICARVLLPAASGASGYAARLDRLERRLELGASPGGHAGGHASGGSGGPGAITDVVAPPLRQDRPAPQAPSAQQPPSAPQASPQPVPQATQAAQQAPEHRLQEQPGQSPQQVSHEPPHHADRRDAQQQSQAQAQRGQQGQAQQRPADRAAGDAPVAATRPPAQPEPDAAPAASTGAPADLDVATIRRVWPEVLGRVFAMRRVTWTFVSQHAQVIDYDGERLVLGIATTGLAQTFRAGNHAEVLRQALIDEIGLDVRVEGVPPGAHTPISHASSPVPPTPAAYASDPRHPVAQEPVAQEPVSPMPGQSSPAAESAPQSRDDQTHSQPAPSQAPPSLARHTPSPAPTQSPTQSTPDTRAADAHGQAESVRQELARAKEATRRSLEARHAGGSRHTPAVSEPAPEDDISLDDEDVEVSGEVGQAVIERLLGGQVLGEFDE